MDSVKRRQADQNPSTQFLRIGTSERCTNQLYVVILTQPGQSDLNRPKQGQINFKFGDGFRQQDTLSFHTSVGHQYQKDVTNNENLSLKINYFKMSFWEDFDREPEKTLILK